MTLALDAVMRPIGLISQQAAACRLTDQGSGPRCELVLGDPVRVYRSAELEIPAPVIVRWPGYLELSRSERRTVTRRVLFARDAWTCQYCGEVADSAKARAALTIDHVKPAHLFASRAAATTWENVTTACRPCNAIKGGFLPYEIGMYPARTPREPHFVQLRFAGRLNAAQRDYVRSYFDLEDDHVL